MLPFYGDWAVQFLDQNAQPLTGRPVRIRRGELDAGTPESLNTHARRTLGQAERRRTGSSQCPTNAKNDAHGRRTGSAWRLGLENGARQYREGNFSADCLCGRDKHVELTREV